MSFSLISAAWALQAFLVIWIGLAKQIPFLRYLGFALFLLAVGKTLIIHMSEMEKVYRIVSFAACGLLLVGAAISTSATVRGCGSGLIWEPRHEKASDHYHLAECQRSHRARGHRSG